MSQHISLMSGLQLGQIQYLIRGDVQTVSLLSVVVLLSDA